MQLKDKTIIPRWYQLESAQVSIKKIEDKKCHPILAIPTGAGKTITICLIIIEWLKLNPNKNVLVVSHVKEILEQNYKSLSNNLETNIGLYSSGLGRKDTSVVTVVGMQSGRNNPSLFKNVGLVIIDECHLVNEEQVGTYREFLANFKEANYVGLTATPYRARGYLHLSENPLFTEIAYDLTSKDNFNRLVQEGYLSKLYSKATDLKMDIPKGVGTVAGDWNNNDLDILFNNNRVSDIAVEEAVKIFKQGKYKKALVFCINIKHSERVSNKFNELGLKSDFVHSKMKGDRDEVMSNFKSGKIDVLSNVEVATTGLDIIDIDMIILLRPTKSMTLHVQMVGRGLRVAPEKGKTHCLVLDFAGNISTLGPVNNVKIDQKGKAIKGGDAPTKECPNCQCLNHPINKYCDACGYKFKFKVKLTTTASELSILARKEPQELTVRSVTYNRHKKKNKPDSLRIDYMVGLRKYHRWLSVESTSLYAADKAKYEIPKILKDGENIDGYFTVDNLLKNQNKFKTPIKIIVDVNEKYPIIENIIYKEDK